MILTIYKQMKRGDLKLSANVELTPGRIRVTGNDSMLMKVIHVSLPFPTKKKIEIENAVVKLEPMDLEENLRFTLKQNVTHPYIISSKTEIISFPKYERFYDPQVLNGGTTDRRVGLII